MERVLKSFDELEFLAQELLEQEEQAIERDPLTTYEEKFYKHVGILINKLKRHGIRAGWDAEAECLELSKMRIGTTCPTIMWASFNIETKEYWFGGEETDLIVSRKSSEVVATIIEWMNNQAPAVR